MLKGCDGIYGRSPVRIQELSTISMNNVMHKHKSKRKIAGEWLEKIETGV